MIYSLLFCRIEKLIIHDNNIDENTKKEFSHMYKNADLPTTIAFIIFFGYSLIYSNIFFEMFFSGAIALNLIFTSIFWVNTEVTNSN